MKRYVALMAAAAGAILFAVLTTWSLWFGIPTLVGAALSVLGAWDLIQTRHSLKRNYPILANIRFLLEAIRPEIRQYFLESDVDGVPFNRSKRAEGTP
jgi:hypothetical protein